MLVMTPDQMDHFLDSLERRSKGPIVYDVETNGLRWWAGDRIIGYSIYLPDLDESFYLPVRHAPHRIDCLGWQAESYQTEKLKRWKHKDRLVSTGQHDLINLNWDPEAIRTILQTTLFSNDRPLIGWNFKFDLHISEAEGFTIPNPTFDVMSAAHLADENEVSYTLDHHARMHFGVGKADDALDQWAKANRIPDVKRCLQHAPLILVAEYAEEDCRLTWRLAERNKARLRGEQPHVFEGTSKTLFTLWQEIGGDYTRALQRMERHGIRVDRELVEESIHLAEGKVDELYHAMAKIAGHEFNPRSPKQLAHILHLPRTSKAFLARFESEFIDLLTDYRQWEKALRTYYRPWLALCDAEGYLHPSLNILTVAARLSCREPNLQNLPRVQPDVPAYDVRRAIIPPDGDVLVSFDYSQIELRIATHYCADETWMDVYQSGGDIHQSTADMLGLDRQSCKTLNFAMLYGMGAEGLSSSLTLAGKPTTVDQASDILYRFKGSKPRLVEFCRRTTQFAYKRRYVEMWTGRRRHYPTDTRYWRGSGDPAHTAVNNLIQGGAAELIRHAITRLDRDFEETRCREGQAPRMHLQIHDDILFSMRPSLLDRWLPHIKERMEHVAVFRVPIVADCKVGPAWSLMEKQEVQSARKAA